ncbi:MAG: Ig-like domain-containing protein [Chloroflexi bacterium]|nr:Ig-like domain-containing protein [Chloroflexota bacterium]
MDTRVFRTFAFVMILVSLGVLACDVPFLASTLGGKPTVTIQSPANGSVFREGEEVIIQSTAKDQNGIVRVELAVDGSVVRTDAPPVPQGQASFTLIQKWKASPGAHTLSVRAFNASGTASDPAFVSVSVAISSAAASPVPTGPLADPTSAPTLTIPLPTLSPTAEATATRRPPTVPPRTPTVTAPPGVWALSIRMDPAEPKRGAPPTFYVTFLNSTGKLAQYRWFVYVYRPEERRPMGETSKIPNDFPPGTFELPAPADWAIRGPGPCEPFVARVAWHDRESNQTTEFSKPDGSGSPTVAFQVCP